MNTDQHRFEEVNSIVPVSSGVHPCSSAVASPLPVPNAPISVRVATRGDLSFIDALQKKQSRAVGWMPTMSLEMKIDAGQILIAVGATLASPAGAVVQANAPLQKTLQTVAAGDASVAPTGERLGYLIAQDRYFKRDDVGVIYQMNIAAEHQRSLVAATLLKSQFERSAYGCKLYCCWCAQDLAANKFWEAMGFVPLAFRTGSPTKGTGGSPRVHIFWQKRIRANDTSTPWWFPSETSGGALKENRIVLPIPLGMGWSEAMPVMLPEQVRSAESGVGRKNGIAALPAPHREARSSRSLQTPNSKFQTSSRLSRPAFDGVKHAKVRSPREATPTPAMKNDPKLVAAARELRDRWLEQVNDGTTDLMPTLGRYDVCRTIDAAVAIEVTTPGLGGSPPALAGVSTKLLTADTLRSAA